MLPRDEVIQFYSNAAVFCCPSVYEPFGIINLEAMACETAVVASAVGGIPEVVVPGETGLLVDLELKPGTFDPVDPAQFSRALAAGHQPGGARPRAARAVRSATAGGAGSRSTSAGRRSPSGRWICTGRSARHDRRGSEGCDATAIEDGRTRVIIEDVTPRVDDGEFPIKRIVGDVVVVEADIFTDGHDAISCALLYRSCGGPAGGAWTEVPMEPLVNDRWRGVVRGPRDRPLLVHRLRLGRPLQDLVARPGKARRGRAGCNGRPGRSARSMIAAAGKNAHPAGGWLARDLCRVACAAGGAEGHRARAFARAGAADAPPRRAALRLHLASSSSVVVDRERARFGAWYELFPRSSSPVPGRHGTFKDVDARLPYVASMGFDVLYLPPIHPIGRSFRKGPNNSTVAAPDDPGSPWAIGAGGGRAQGHPPGAGHARRLPRSW